MGESGTLIGARTERSRRPEAGSYCRTDNAPCFIAAPDLRRSGSGPASLKRAKGRAGTAARDGSADTLEGAPTVGVGACRNIGGVTVIRIAGAKKVRHAPDLIFKRSSVSHMREMPGFPAQLRVALFAATALMETWDIGDIAPSLRMSQSAWHGGLFRGS